MERRSKSVLHLTYSQNFQKGPRFRTIFESEYLNPNIWTDNIWIRIFESDNSISWLFFLPALFFLPPLFFSTFLMIFFTPTFFLQHFVYPHLFLSFFDVFFYCHFFFQLFCFFFYHNFILTPTFFGLKKIFENLKKQWGYFCFLKNVKKLVKY